MAAKNMREQGIKTREKVRKKLATIPRRVDDIAHRCGLTPGMARKHLHALVKEGIAVQTKKSHALMFSKAPKTAPVAQPQQEAVQ